MTKKELLKRIEELERRIEALESRKFIIQPMLQPFLQQGIQQEPFKVTCDSVQVKIDNDLFIKTKTD